jgi:hypothetical protein
MHRLKVHEKTKAENGIKKGREPDARARNQAAETAKETYFALSYG